MMCAGSNPTLGLGTTNNYKIMEMAGRLRPLGIDLVTGPPIDPEETGMTFRDNCLIKVLAHSQNMRDTYAAKYMARYDCTYEQAVNHLRLNGFWTMSEDSGLDVPALGGLPGPFSARWDDCLVDGNRVVGHTPSGRGRDEIDVANNLRVLQMLKERGIEDPLRAASFVLCMMVADVDGKILFETERRSDGWIVKEPRGRQGFGYDPIFASGHSYRRTWAEVDMMRKNLFSHRRQAMQDFMIWLGHQLMILDEPVQGNVAL